MSSKTARKQRLFRDAREDSGPQHSGDVDSNTTPSRSGTGLPGTRSGRRWSGDAAAVVFLGLFGSAVAAAQTGATLFGDVTDAGGAAVPHATITVTNVETQQTRRLTSGSDGDYAVPGLAPGTYRLTAEADGYANYIEQNIVLQVGENRRDSIALPLRSTAQSVTVSGVDTDVDTRSSTISEVVDSARVQQLPLNGRNALQLQTLVAGASATSSGGGGQAENSVTSINGSRQAENGYTLDGADNEDAFFFTPSVFPNPDAQQEFRLDTSNYGAQAGLGSGAQMYAVTRSGTNAFHGTAFEYLRNQAFDAAGFFAKQAPPFHQNQFGGTAGGPVLKNRLFFFFAYQGTRQRSSPNAETLTVPDAKERTGDFSEIAKQLKFPGTSQPAPGNVFPSADLNSASLKFLSAFVPLPNSSNNVYSYAAKSLLNDDQYIGRLDETLGTHDQLSGRILSDGNLQDQVPSTNDLPGFSANIAYTDWNLAVNEAHVFTPNLLNQFTFAWSDIQRVQTPVVPSQTTWGDLGAGVVRAASGPIGYDTEVQSYFTAETRWPLNQYRHEFQYSDTLNWTHNAHTLAVGGDLRRQFTHQYQDYLADGQFIFSAVYTGNALADFETGREQSFTQDSYNAGEPVNLTPDLFVQDDWKAARKLTVNVGLRWNPFVPYDDKLNAVSQFRPGQQSTVYPTAPLGYVFPGDVGVPKDTINARWHDFAPRLGFAYDVFGNGKTSIRGGYGIFDTYVREQALNNLSSNQPFGIALNISEPSGGLTDPYAGVGNPFPYTPPQTTGEKQSYLFKLPLTLTVWSPSFRDGRVHQWNANVQQQAGRWIFTVAYVGAVGEHLFLQYEGDPAVYGRPEPPRRRGACTRRISAPSLPSSVEGTPATTLSS
jgi:hypothetical protein